MFWLLDDDAGEDDEDDDDVLPGDEMVGDDELSVVLVVVALAELVALDDEALDFVSPFSINVVEFLRELFWLLGSDDDEDVGVPGTCDKAFIMVNVVEDVPGFVTLDDVARRDVLDSELSDVDELLAYELAVVAAVVAEVDDEPLPIVSMYLDVCRFFSKVFCNTSILSCRSFTSILDSFS